MKKSKTVDGYDVYSIEKDNINYYLGNYQNYKDDINKLIDNLDELKFDSLILIFGIDTGEYLKELTKIICERNTVVIFEPNEEVLAESENLKIDKQINILKFDSNLIRPTLASLIGLDNFDNLYVHAFGNYSDVYKDDYERFIENLDAIYLAQSGNVALSYRCRESFMKNQIFNLDTINGASPLNSYVSNNKELPAFIVSAGPSLDKNIHDMVSNIDKVKKSIVIATNRTFNTLIKHGIKPDFVISIDPSDAMFDMMKENLNSDVPLVFCEYTNRYLTRNYKGPKIYISGVLNTVVKGLKGYWNLLQGGSVAHSCISFADMLGCNPIILVGQDFAYTFDKHHSDDAIFSIDATTNHTENTVTTDVYGNSIKSTTTLNLFKDAMEIHIKEYKKFRDVNFINASYGADINGAPHRELCEIFKEKYFRRKKKQLKKNTVIDLDPDDVKKSILEYVDDYIEKSEQGIEQCEILTSIKENKSLIDVDGEDIDFQRFLFVLDIVNTFERSLESSYLGGYFYKFIFSIKRECFRMLAKDYTELTSDMKYQSKTFLQYFKSMNKMLLEAKNIILVAVSELEEQNIINYK